MTGDSEHLLQTFILSISATKQDGTADPSSRVECLQLQPSHFHINLLYVADVLVFLLAINRSNASHSQLESCRDDGDDTRHTVSQQAQLDLAGCLHRCLSIFRNVLYNSSMIFLKGKMSFHYCTCHPAGPTNQSLPTPNSLSQPSRTVVRSEYERGKGNRGLVVNKSGS